MPEYGRLTTDKTLAETRADIENVFRKWAIEEYRIIASGKERVATVRFWVKDKEAVLTCSRFGTTAINLRALYLALNAVRLATERGILEEFAKAAAAMLPAGTVKRAPYEVLGIQPDAPIAVAEAAYKVLARYRHPDTGGSEEAMRELNQAIEEFRKGNQL